MDLYRISFPHRERDSIHKFLYHDGKDGNILVFFDDIKFVGFACAISCKDITHILYFAINPNLRGKGYGTKCLDLVKNLKPNNRFIVDIEKDEESCPNHIMRKRRELFYLHDAFVESDIEYYYKGVKFVILCANGMISKKEFIEFWMHFAKKDDLGYYIVNHLKIS